MNKKQTVIIVAAGQGLRYGSAVAKQFLLLQETPIFIYTIQQFISVFPSIQIILVVATNQRKTVKRLLKEYNLEQVILVNGGKTRFHSVQNGLQCMNNDTEIVGIHDAVRPMVSHEVIKNSYLQASIYGCAIPCIGIDDSIRKVEQQHSCIVNRKNYVRIQTPQCFEADLLQQAYTKPFQDYFTDDASVYEHAGNAIHLVKGNKENTKITTPEDLQLLEAILLQSKK